MVQTRQMGNIGSSSQTARKQKATNSSGKLQASNGKPPSNSKSKPVSDVNSRKRRHHNEDSSNDSSNEEPEIQLSAPTGTSKAKPTRKKAKAGLTTQEQKIWQALQAKVKKAEQNGHAQKDLGVIFRSLIYRF